MWRSLAFYNGNIVKGSFVREMKDNLNPEENADERNYSQITLINWVTEPQIIDHQEYYIK